MSNIRDGVGCPHGRLDFCYVCDELEIEAQRMVDEGGPPSPFEDADQDRYDNRDPVESGDVPEGGEFIE
jgi:hypothetical protein